MYPQTILLRAIFAHSIYILQSTLNDYRTVILDPKKKRKVNFKNIYITIRLFDNQS